MNMHIYEVRPRKDRRGVDLISNVLPFGRLWYGEPSAVGNAIGYAMHRRRSHDAVIPSYGAGIDPNRPCISSSGPCSSQPSLPLRDAWIRRDPKVPTRQSPPKLPEFAGAPPTPR